MKTITMHELYKQIPQLKENEVILDVRTPAEYREGHIQGSINIPHTEVANHVDRLKKYDRIFMHCRSGGRVEIAYAALKAKGLTNLVCIVDGGIKDWIEAGYPLESDN